MASGAGAASLTPRSSLAPRAAPESTVQGGFGGETAVRRQPPERALAEAYYQQARVLAEELGMRPLQAHCHRGLGTLSAQEDQREQTRAALSTAIKMYRTMDMTFWLPQAEATLAQVG